MSFEENSLQGLLTKQFDLEDIKYDIFGLYHDAGLGLPKIVVSDSHATHRSAIHESLEENLRDHLWREGQEVILSRFEYIRSKRQGRSDMADREVPEEALWLRVEIGDHYVPYIASAEQAFGICFENRLDEASPWGTFLSKGIWNICFFESACFVCRCPTKILRDARRQLHSETEAAVQWANGESYYFIHGVTFPEDLWSEVTTKVMKPSDVIRIDNAEQRTLVIRIYGYDSLLKDLHSKVLDNCIKNGIEYELLQVNLNDDFGRRAHLLKVVCPSTGKKSLLRVAPSVRKVRNALAWTFPRVSASEYEQLVLES